MARRNESILDLLTLLPWWVSVVLSAVSYVVLRFLVPAIDIRQKGPADVTYMFLKGLAGAAPRLAPVAAIVLLTPAFVSALNSRRKRKLLDGQKSADTVRNLGWKEFEELAGEFYRRLGYSVTENDGYGPDGGVDLTLRKEGELVVVQCKQWRSVKVGVNKVRELYGVQVARKADRSVLMTSGSFTREAEDFAASKPMELVDGGRLLEIVKSVQKPDKTTPVAMPSPVTCPKCGSKMILKTTRKGPNAGGQFWGCSKFPDCRGTRPYSPGTQHPGKDRHGR